MAFLIVIGAIARSAPAMTAAAAADSRLSLVVVNAAAAPTKRGNNNALARSQHDTPIRIPAMKSRDQLNRRRRRNHEIDGQQNRKDNQ